MIVDHTLHTPDTPQPVAALMIHSTGGADPYRGGQQVLLTRHTVHSTPQGPVIGAGHVFTERDREELDALLHNRPGAQRPALNLIPATVLAQGRECLVWRLPGRVRPMYFKNGHQQVVLQAVPWPNLILGVTGRAFYVAALLSHRRPTLKTALYHAPLMNISVSGLLCTGNADLPAGCDLADMPGWEEALTRTFFTHVSHAQTLRLRAGNPPAHPARRSHLRRGVDNLAHLKFWRALERHKAQVFPREHLEPMDLKLEDFLRQVAREN